MVVKCCQIIPLAHLLSAPQPAMIRLVSATQAVLADPHLLLCLAQDLALLALASRSELGTGDDSVVRNILLELAMEECVSL